MTGWAMVPGPWPAILGGDTVVALAGDGADAYARMLLPVVQGGAALEDVLDVLVAGGIAAAPDVVIAQRRGSRLTAAARGRGRAGILDAQGRTVLVEGRAARSWHETAVDDARGFVAGFDGDVAVPPHDADDEVPAADGALSVSRILLRVAAPPAPATPPYGHTLSFAEVPAQGAVHEDEMIDDVSVGLSGIVCAAGHPNPPTRDTCVTCGIRLGRSAVASVGRPSLGTIGLPDGTQLPLGGEMIVGRSPRVERVEGHALPRLVRLEDSSADVSRNHARIFTEGWNVIVEDLGSSNGTIVIAADGTSRHLRTGETALLTRGTVLDLGGVHLTVDGAP